MAVVDLAAAPDGSGLWLVSSAGRVEPLGGVTRRDDATASRPVVAIAAHSSDGYWVATAGNGPGAITGRVLDDLGAPAPGACVFFGESSFPQAQTTADGTFRIAPVGVGSYVLKIGSC